MDKVLPEPFNHTIEVFVKRLLRGVFAPGCHSNLLHEASGFMGSGLCSISFILVFLGHNSLLSLFSQSTTSQELVPPV